MQRGCKGSKCDIVLTLYLDMNSKMRGIYMIVSDSFRPDSYENTAIGTTYSS